MKNDASKVEKVGCIFSDVLQERANPQSLSSSSKERFLSPCSQLGTTFYLCSHGRENHGHDSSGAEPIKTQSVISAPKSGQFI